MKNSKGKVKSPKKDRKLDKKKVEEPPKAK